MFYRRKILLALLEAFGCKLETTSLQNILLLVSNRQEKPDFHFVAHEFGGYSYQAAADLKTMAKYKQVEPIGNDWFKVDPEPYLPVLKETDRRLIEEVKQETGDLSGDELIRLVYRKYPQLAIKSTLARRLLTAAEYQKVEEARPKSGKTILFTIGYEGISLEEYMNLLVANDIKVLCDIRGNPFSMKFGFSKSQLQDACNRAGIVYDHIPQLGIESEKRQILNTQADYDQLFAFYRKEILTRTLEYQDKIITLLAENKRVALTCYEADVDRCHRKHLAEAITKRPAFAYGLKHL